MAHVNCIGRWEKSSLGGVMEGNGVFVIDDHNTEDITGTHQGEGGLHIVGKCTDGKKIRFYVIKANGECICYLKGKITPGTGKFFINGKFLKPLDDADAVDPTNIVVLEEGRRVLLAADDWTAEKPT